ncbi:hypothetical protein H4R20_001622 [Coemansia guatemalensis]|uniref:P-loop containing nucleoside triphosphate hydrolase protein n=1 Tax=Coemansia guatemalensis TaxID=2761395 RepID=A0A9W8I5G7_9FUNG|nr:hypothetical protein H4R20_001622 [Coemansia guatemalensis]
MASQFPYLCLYTISLGLQTAAAAVAVCLHYSEQLHNRIASTPLLLFWLISVVLLLTRLRSALSAEYINDFHGLAIPILLFTAAGSIAFVLECLPKPRELFKPVDGDDNSAGFGELKDSDSDYTTFGSPEERANVFSRFTYTWVKELLAEGCRRQLHIGDIWKMDGLYRPDVVNAQFQRNWQKELKSGNPSLFRATFRTFWKIWTLATFYELIRITMISLRPVIVSSLIGFTATYGTDQGSPIEHGYFYAVLLFLASLELSVTFRQRNNHGQRVKTLIRTSYMTAIYQKALTLSNDARQKYDVGSLVTHMSIDAEYIATLSKDSSHDMWSDPLRIIMSLFLLYQKLGQSALVGVIVMLVCAPIMSHYAQIVSARTILLMGYRDQRVGVISEVLAGIKVIKMYAWESSFMKRINNVRVKLELDIIHKNNILKAVLHSGTKVVTLLVSFATFGAYSLFDNVSRGPLNAQMVFVGLPLLMTVRSSLERVPKIIPEIGKAAASFRRISELLTADEIDIGAIECLPYNRNSSESSADDELVRVSNGSFTWSLAEEPMITDIDINCKRDELVAVIGQVGSGKSSLLSAILGDMIKCSGSVTIRGSVAYVPQQPWILNATLRDNILFGSNFDQELFDKVIDACALRQDVVSLPAGVMTEIGERGINLSGGQKMRVSLARAIYARADVYILDDPLAAVDAHVSKHIFTHVLGPQGMLRSRVRILVTNAVQYLNSVDNIIMLRDGGIIEQGPFLQVMDSQGDVYEFIHRHIGEDQAPTEDTSAPMIIASGANVEDADKASSSRNVHAEQGNFSGEAGPSSRITAKEFRDKGRVKWRVYRNYLDASGMRNVLTVIVALLFAVIGEVCTNLWLKNWTSSNHRMTSNNMSNPAHSMLYYLLVYGAIGLFVLLANLVQLVYIWARCSTKASTVVHQNMLTGVLRSPMSFFDTTPNGRILNRFSSDMQRCDEELPKDITELTASLYNLLPAAALAGISSPPMIVVISLLVFIGYRYQTIYISSSREIRRLDSTTCSPIYAHFQESFNGISSIRAYSQQSRFIAEMERRVGLHMRVDNTHLLLNQWFSMILETLGNIAMFVTALLAIASIHYYGYGNSDMEGLAISSTLILASGINWTMRHYSEMEISMTHLERATEYADLPPEAAEIIDDHRPKEAWPEQGAVEFKNYSTRYRDGLDLVLKNLSFRVQPRHKVGIVGRTGAGKSSLTLALFRIIEAAGGQILLDGEDISKYGLLDVRSKLSIIPQDPVLFAGTVRENVDPFCSYSDQDIWRALKQAHLADYIRSKDERLEFMVAQSGENFSVGQRQLICLARALLKHAKVLVLDEATAAIDNTTDEIIQQTIRSEFKDCTVLTIAHRLNTVIDSDMVLVIDDGQLAEYDTPQNLLANKNSLFSKIVEEAHTSTAAQLIVTSS